LHSWREIPEAIIGDEIAAAPDTLVDINQARHDDHVGCIDHLGAGVRQIDSDRFDRECSDRTTDVRPISSSD
jgi:hypothetical protein